MKEILVVVLAVTLLAQVCQVSCDSIPQGITTSATSTTAKPWTQKLKDGLGKFFQGAAIASAVQQGFQNSRSSGKHKSIDHSSGSPVTSPKH